MKIYIDFDDTIAQSLPVVVRIINQRHKRNVDVRNIGKWNFSDVYPDISTHDIVQVFGEDEFFQHLQPKPDAVRVLHKFCKRNELIVVSKVDTKALWNKNNWLDKTLRNVGIDIRFIGIPLGKSKGLLDMEGSIMIDDNVTFLNETNAKYKILFDNDTKFHRNQEWDGLRVDNWKDLDKILSEIIGKEKGITNGKI
jgi:5'(3')-deoxyribonucleotidase